MKAQYKQTDMSSAYPPPLQVHDMRRDNPPRDGCAGYRDQYTGEFDCEYQAPFSCEECMYCEYRKTGGKNPQAKKWYKDEI